jgi:hypothetical protein
MAGPWIVSDVPHYLCEPAARHAGCPSLPYGATLV